MSTTGHPRRVMRSQSRLALSRRPSETVSCRRHSGPWCGLVTVGAGTHGFSLHLVDEGQPGTEDRFELLVESAYRAGNNQTIEGGNDQIHPPEHE